MESMPGLRSRFAAGDNAVYGISSKRLSYCQNFMKNLLNCDSIIQFIKIYASNTPGESP